MNDAPQVTTSNNPTDPKAIKIAPRVHKRITRANTPGQLPAIITQDNHTPSTRKSPRFTTQDETPISTFTEPSSACIPLYSPNIIEMNTITSPDANHSLFDTNIKHLCNGVQHPILVKSSLITKNSSRSHKCAKYGPMPLEKNLVT